MMRSLNLDLASLISVLTGLYLDPGRSFHMSNFRHNYNRFSSYTRPDQARHLSSAHRSHGAKCKDVSAVINETVLCDTYGSRPEIGHPVLAPGYLLQHPGSARAHFTPSST